MDILLLKIHMYPWKNRDWKIQWNPVNSVTNGPKKFGHINEGFFIRKCLAVFARRPKEVAVIMRWPYYRGGRNVGFHCSMMNCIIFYLLVVHLQTLFAWLGLTGLCFANIQFTNAAGQFANLLWYSNVVLCVNSGLVGVGGGGVEISPG